MWKILTNRKDTSNKFRNKCKNCETFKCIATFASCMHSYCCSLSFISQKSPLQSFKFCCHFSSLDKELCFVVKFVFLHTDLVLLYTAQVTVAGSTNVKQMPEKKLIWKSPVGFNSSLTITYTLSFPESWLWTSLLRHVGRGCVATLSWSLRSMYWMLRVCRDRTPMEVGPLHTVDKSRFCMLMITFLCCQVLQTPINTHRASLPQSQ